ncbi:hypothetical protein FKP32DRAFT_1592896 [Trametes sanguinea]|nr:hypothetical protein FKP32DRAFT_1592896 [Trametes sanguinea]
MVHGYRHRLRDRIILKRIYSGCLNGRQHCRPDCLTSLIIWVDYEVWSWLAVLNTELSRSIRPMPSMRLKLCPFSLQSRLKATLSGNTCQLRVIHHCFSHHENSEQCRRKPTSSRFGSSMCKRHGWCNTQHPKRRLCKRLTNHMTAKCLFFAPEAEPEEAKTFSPTYNSCLEFRCPRGALIDPIRGPPQRHMHALSQSHQGCDGVDATAATPQLKLRHLNCHAHGMVTLGLDDSS